MPEALLEKVAKITDTTTCAIILATIGEDAKIAASLLADVGIASISVPDLCSFMQYLGDDVTFAVITEETLRSADLRMLSSWIGSQPDWSDLPFIILTNRGGGPQSSPAAARLSEILGNVSFIERSFHATTFVSAARTALRGRRRQYEARLRLQALDEGERRLQTALEAGRLGTWEFDLATGVLSTSTTFREIFGRGHDDSMTYDDLFASVHPKDRCRMQAAVSATVKHGVDYAIEYRFVRCDGSFRWAEIRAQVYREPCGEALKLVGVCADITDRMRAEEQQRQLNEMLEERVTARTTELKTAHETVMMEVAHREKAEEQLRQLQKMEAIGQLTGGVAHDFNNLLMAVLANLELLRKHAHDTKAIRLIDGALQGARRGASLTQRLLAFVRRQDHHVVPVDLCKLVADIEDLIKRSVGSRISVETSFPCELPAVLADANQIELAVLNLAVNARDAMPDGGLIHIMVEKSLPHPGDADLACGDYLVLSVTDTGSGMDAATLKKAMEPFFSTKELGKGTGLGLSMIHALALQLKGTLKLDSIPGHGTKASLWIPVATEMPVAEPKDMNNKGTDKVETELKKILIVDDDALICMSSADMLCDLGHDVTEAHSGLEALDILKKNDGFDLMITDYSMPGMNGAELVRAARLLIPDLPVLMATGYADLPPGTNIEVQRLGKPYSQDQLASEISKVLTTRS